MHWKPGDDICVRFDDKTAEERSDEKLAEMIERMRQIANEYDFDLSCYGSWKGTKAVAVGETKIMYAYEGGKCPVCERKGKKPLKRTE